MSLFTRRTRTTKRNNNMYPYPQFPNSGFGYPQQPVVFIPSPMVPPNPTGTQSLQEMMQERVLWDEFIEKLEKSKKKDKDPAEKKDESIFKRKFTFIETVSLLILFGIPAALAELHFIHQAEAFLKGFLN